MDKNLSRWLRVIFTLASLSAAFYLMSAMGTLVKILIISALLAYIMDPLTVRLESRGMSRGGATLIIFLSFFAGLAVAMILLLPVLTTQLDALQTGLTPEQVTVSIQNFDRYLTKKLTILGVDNLDLAGRLQRTTLRLSEWFLTHILDLVSLLTHMVLIPFIVFFLLRDGRQMKKQLATLIPNHYFEFSLNLISKLDVEFGNFLRGQFIDALIFGLLSVCTLWAIGLKYFLVVGIFAGIANLIPFVGPVAGGFAAIIASIIDSGGLAEAGSVALAFIVLKLIDDSLIQPLVVARSVKMHPLLVLLAVIIGGKFFGVLGMLLSVPVTGFIKVAIREGIEGFRRYRLT